MVSWVTFVLKQICYNFCKLFSINKKAKKHAVPCQFVNSTFDNIGLHKNNDHIPTMTEVQYKVFRAQIVYRNPSPVLFGVCVYICVSAVLFSLNYIFQHVVAVFLASDVLADWHKRVNVAKRFWIKYHLFVVAYQFNDFTWRSQNNKTRVDKFVRNLAALWNPLIFCH